MALGKCHLEWPGSPRQLTTKCFHVLDSHPEHGELVQLAGHGVACGHQRGQLVNEAVHLIPAPLLDLAVSLPAHTHTHKAGHVKHMGQCPKQPSQGEGATLLSSWKGQQTLCRYLRHSSDICCELSG